MHSEVNPENPGYETRDVNASFAFWSLFSLGVIVVICIIVAMIMFNILGRDLPASARTLPSQVAPQRVLPPAPRLQTAPPLELKEFQDDETQTLTTYGWVDKNAQKVRIPIDRAVDLVAQRGLPFHKQGEPLPVVAPAPPPAANGFPHQGPPSPNGPQPTPPSLTPAAPPAAPQAK